jgi:23S rRNA (cytidine2498-2'-O)-methyltransferase
LVENNPSKIIFTVKPEFAAIGLKELAACDPEMVVNDYLEEAVGLVTLKKEFQDFADCLRTSKPIFLQHICPVHVEMEGPIELKEITDSAKKLIHLMNPELTFSVQTRIFDSEEEVSYKVFEVNDAVASVISEEGFSLNVTEPQQVLSIVVAGVHIYIGISETADNISSWAGGKHRLAHEKEQISRAEFKLIEAIKVFRLRFPKRGTALDLGAAPGGWTRVLLQHHLDVIAVDPAKLDKNLKKNSRVKHYRETAQRFFNRDLGLQFDLIVNDMKMDTNESVKIINLAYGRLKKGGMVILTLKLPKSGVEKKINQALKNLQSKYNVIAIKHLFHNRSEVTVILKK